MLRSDRELALDEVTEICKLAADLYEEAAEIVQDSDLGEFFQDVARARYRLLAELEEEIRKRGVLPSEPDLDREGLDHILTRLRAVMAKDERRVLLEKCERIEEAGEERVEHALDLAFEGRTPEVMLRIKDEIARARKRLEEEKKKH